MKKSIDLDNFNQMMNSSILSLIKELRSKGVGVALVGGAVRDWILHGEISKDLDFEIYPLSCDDTKQWKELLCDVFKEGYQKNDFFVHKIEIDGFDIEFAPARLEFYAEEQTKYSHSDFKAEYLLSFSPENSFIRRDFTINALGIHFLENSIEFVDPFKGLTHLEQKKLIPCGENFSKDPVRLLRALRFQLRDKVEFSSELLDSLEKFNLRELSEYYFFKEAFSSGHFFEFTKNLFEWIRAYKIEHADFINELSILEKTEPFVVTNKRELFFGLCYRHHESSVLDLMVRLLNLKKNVFHRWFELIHLLKERKLIQNEKKIRFEEFLLREDREFFLKVFSLKKSLKWEESLELFESLDPELLTKIRLVFKKESELPGDYSMDLASLPISDRKLYQAYQFYFSLVARTA